MAELPRKRWHSEYDGRTWDELRTLYVGGGDTPPELARIPGTDTVVAVLSWARRVEGSCQLGSVISRTCADAAVCVRRVYLQL